MFNRLKKLVELRVSLVLPHKITHREKLWIKKMLIDVYNCLALHFRRGQPSWDVLKLAQVVIFFWLFILHLSKKKKEALWRDMMSFNIITHWLLCGDFNSVMNTDERIGASVREIEMKDIKECMVQRGM